MNKILWLTKEYPPHVYGGAGVHVEYLAAELAKLITIEVRCFGEQRLEGDRLSVQGYTPDRAAADRFPPALRTPYETISNDLSMSLDPVDACLVHCHTWYTHFAGILLKKAYGLPLVLTTHSLEPLRPWKREQLGGWYEVSSWMEKSAIEAADGIVAVSNGMREDILRHFEVEESRVRVIHNGIDTTEYRKTDGTDVLQRRGIDPRSPCVLFLGRITPQKGTVHFVRAIPWIDPAATVVLCAGAPDTAAIRLEVEDALERARALRRGHGGQVVWIEEMIPRAEAIALYSHASVYCCPSIYEPFGIVILEAMACGTPVVASATGGIVEIVEEGRTGFLVEVGERCPGTLEPMDAEGFSRRLAERINCILADPDLGRSMGEKGRQRVEARFSWTAIARKTLELYRDIPRMHTARGG